MLTVRNHVPVEKIDRIKLFTPDGAGKRWEPVEHGELLAEIRTQAKAKGWSVTDPSVALNKSKAWMAATFLVRNVSVKPPEGFHYSLGVFNTNDRRRSLTVFSGVTSRTTGLGYVLAKSVEGVSHQCVVLAPTVTWILESWEATLPHFPRVIADLRNRLLNQDEWCRVLFDCCRKPQFNCLPWDKLGKVDKLYREAADKSAWGLYTAVSGVVSTMPPMKQLDVLARVIDTLPS